VALRVAVRRFVVHGPTSSALATPALSNAIGKITLSESEVRCVTHPPTNACSSEAGESCLVAGAKTKSVGSTEIR
jgi:hypothetical protein